MGVVRPGSASPGAGMSSFFLNENMGAAPVLRDTHQYRQRASPAHQASTSYRSQISARFGHGGQSATSLAHIADERLLLAADQHQHGADDAEHQPCGGGEDAQHHGVPQPLRDVSLDRRLEQLQAARMDIVPDLAERRVHERASGDRLGAVVNESNEAAGEDQEADEAEQESDHVVPRAPDREPGIARLCARFNQAGAAPPRHHSIRGRSPLRWRRLLRYIFGDGCFASIAAPASPCGGMAEWLKAHAWKACIRETVSWVRIPLPPPPHSRPTFSAGIRTHSNPTNHGPSREKPRTALSP